MILTPDQRLRVFVSSTLQELAEERKAARRAVESLKLIPVMFEAGARPHPPQALYRAYLEQSDVFLAIYWKRYGWVAPEMEISGLEDELRMSEGMPRLVYVKDGDEREPGLEAMLERIRQDASVSYKTFHTEAELEGVIKDDLILMLTERFHAESDTPEVIAAPNNPAPLPAQTTPIVGREEEVTALLESLQKEAVRLLTLTGPGGIGKTRLAIETAQRARPQFTDVYYVSLATLKSPTQVTEWIAKALGISSGGAVPAVQDLQDFFRDGCSLVILDNFEHLLSAAPVVAEALADCPGLKILVTSRAPLRVRGEHEFYVTPLAVPPRGSSERLAEYDAVKLFIDRASAVRPDLALDERNVAAVAEICGRLDGLPLAIELAAARTRLLPPPELLKRLGERLPVLVGGARDMPERHQTLRDTIVWSFDLLDDQAKYLFIRLGAFRGGFTLEAAEEICGVPSFDFLEALSSLIEHSLVRSTMQDHGEPRFSMLETVREFAAQLLLATSDRHSTHEKHGRYYAAMARDVGGAVRSWDQTRALERMEADLGNMRVAYEWLVTHDQLDLAADALFESWWFWWTRGYVEACRRAAERLVSMPDKLSRIGYAKALATKAVMAFWQSDFEVAVPGFYEAGEIFDLELDQGGMAICNIGRGLVESFMGDREGGRARLRKARLLFEAADDLIGVTAAVVAGTWEETVGRHFDSPRAEHEKAIELSRQIGSALDAAMSEGNLGMWLVYHGEEEEGLGYLGRSVRALAQSRHFGVTGNIMDYIADAASRRGRWLQAVTIMGGAEAIRERIHAPAPPAAAKLNADRLERAGVELGADVVASAYASGRQLGFDDAVAAALSETALVPA